MPESPAITLFFRAQKYLVVFGALYLGVICLLVVPFFQSHAIFLNSVKIPFFADFSAPERYGLAPNRTLDFKITTSDNEVIGAWFVLSDSYYHSLPDIPSEVSDHIKPALEQYPTILFLHGNAATRAFSARVRQYQGFSTRLGANVLAIDYRGFADSTGKPSEAGLTRDARAGFDWLVSQGKRPEDILIVGQSLGTGVSGQLGAELAAQNIKCRGIVLLSPFSSIREVLSSYQMFGFVPLIKPISIIPGALQLVHRAVVHHFDTLKAVPNITASVLIAHAENDWDIPPSHSDILFQAFLEPHLPPLDLPENILGLSENDWNLLTEKRRQRQAKRDQLVETRVLKNFGKVTKFKDGDRTVTLVKTLEGGHDYLGVQEGLQDIIGKIFLGDQRSRSMT